MMRGTFEVAALLASHVLLAPACVGQKCSPYFSATYTVPARDCVLTLVGAMNAGGTSVTSLTVQFEDFDGAPAASQLESWLGGASFSVHLVCGPATVVDAESQTIGSKCDA